MIEKSPKKTENDNYGLLKPSSSISIPIEILADRSVATLEAVVEYMKDFLKLSYHEIAVLLQRDDRTVWTCYKRAKKKRLNG